MLYNFNAAQVEPQQVTFDPVPPGNYVAIVTDSDLRPTRSGRAIKLTFRIVEGQHTGRLIWANLNVENASAQAQEIAQKQLSSLCHAVGVINLTDTLQLHDKPVRIRVKVRPAVGEYAASNDVTGYDALAGGAALPAATHVAPRPSFAPAAAAPVAAAPAAPWARKAA
jgi:hypothetical protein